MSRAPSPARLLPRRADETEWVPVVKWSLISASILLVAGGLYWILFASGGKGNLSGQVTVNGQPLPLGTMSFFCQHGKGEVHSCPIKNGAYEIEGVPAGTVKIAIISFDPARMGGSAGSSQPRSVAIPKQASLKYLEIPKHFSDPDSSGLMLVIRAGDRFHNIDLRVTKSQEP